MNRSFLLIAVILIAAGILFDWRLSQAVDAEQPASALDAVEVSVTAMLAARIEALERRVATLEQTESPVRQADSRASEFDIQPAPFPPRTTAPLSQPKNDDAQSPQINGQKWRIYMLGNTKSVSQNR